MNIIGNALIAEGAKSPLTPPFIKGGFGGIWDRHIVVGVTTRVVFSNLIFLAGIISMLGLYSAPAAASVSMTISIHKVSDNSLESPPQIKWTGVTLPNGFVLADDYIQIDSTITDATGGIEFFTDNTAADASPKYTGVISATAQTPAGLVNMSNTTQKVPTAWRITDSIIPLGGPPPIDPNASGGLVWFYHEDRAQIANNQGASDFQDGADYITVEKLGCFLQPPVLCIHTFLSAVPFGFATAPSPNFIYLEANFIGATTPNTYQTSTLRLEAFTQ